MTSVLNKYQMMKQDHLVFSFAGTLNGELIAAILQLADSEIKKNKPLLRRKKNVMNVLIECLQNIYYHAAEAANLPQQFQECFVGLGLEKETLFITSANFVDAGKVPAFNNKLEKLNSMDKTELHQHYLQVLNEGLISDKGGAGLGLIRMLRESGQPLVYSFATVNESMSFFSLRINIDQINTTRLTSSLEVAG
jgi:hypothetical protein